jgi:hypothetical protein
MEKVRRGMSEKGRFLFWLVDPFPLLVTPFLAGANDEP